MTHANPHRHAGTRFARVPAWLQNVILSARVNFPRASPILGTLITLGISNESQYGCILAWLGNVILSRDVNFSLCLQ